METRKEEIRKPPVLLTVQLFVFMMFVILNIWNVVVNFKTSWMNNLDELSPAFVVSSCCLDLAMYGYALLGICKALQHKPYSVLMLRLSVFYIFTQFAVKSFCEHYLTRLSVPLAVFGFVFFVYLFKSKQLKAFIPKAERKIGPFGAIGWLLYLAVVPLYAFPLHRFITLRMHSRPVAVSSTRLPDRTFTDGMARFKALEAWQLDTIVGDAKRVYLFAFNNGGDHNIMVNSRSVPCHSRLDFCQLLANASEHVLEEPFTLKEVKYGEFTVGGSRCYYECYALGVSSGKYKYWSYAALCDAASLKVLELSYKNNNWQASEREIKRFMQAVTFNLKQ